MKHAVIGVIVNERGEVLVGKKVAQASRFPGLWHIPGGHVEQNESHEDAVRREMKEETNLDVEIIEKIGEAYIAHRMLQVSWFLCKPLSNDLKSGSDLTDVRWMEKEKLIDFIAHDVKRFWPQEFLLFLKQ